MKKMILAGLAMMAVSFGAFADVKPLTFCGGAQGGFYDGFAHQIGKDIETNSKGLVSMSFKTTKGSVDSAAMLKSGECDLAILQSDAVTSRPMPSDLAITDAHQEAIYWIHAKNGKVKDFSDMSDDENKNLGIAIVSGSGAEVTLRNFGIVDKDYKDLNIVPFKTWFLAAKATAEGKVRKGGNDIMIAGMIYVGMQGKISTEITGEYRDDLNIGQIDVGAFKKVKDANGNPLYVTCDVEKTNGMETSTTFASPDTYCLKAQVVYNNAIFEGMDEEQATVLQTVMDKTIVQNVRQQRSVK